MFTQPFSALGKSDAALAGGKGASLGEMLNAGIPVPDGYVVLADTFEHFLKETDLVQEIESILSNVDHEAIHTVDDASEQICGLILSRAMPEDIKAEILSSFTTLNTEFVAVRSSATAEDGAEHAWAGQLESYLNITKDDVVEKVQRCWSSLFTPRAIFYRFEKGLDTTKISVAVVVQKMVNSQISGIAFSVHPVTEDRNQIIIEAGLGLGEAIVSGSVTPDSYVVEKTPRNIIDINVNTQSKALYRDPNGGNIWKDLSQQDANTQVLTEPQILELADIIMRIENHYGFPCDIEWAWEHDTFYIVQSRPITTLSDNTKNEQLKSLEIFLTRDAPLIVIEHWWDKGCANTFLAFFGFQFPKIISVKTLDNVFVSYWNTRELDGYTRGFSTWLNNNSDSINLIEKRLVEGLTSFKKIKALDKQSSEEELIKALDVAVCSFLEGLPAVDAVHILPSIHEQLQVAGKSPFDHNQLNKLISLREDMGNHFFNEGVDAVYALLKLIEVKRGWKKDILKYITYEELKNVLTGLATLPEEKLYKRIHTPFALIDGNLIFEPEINTRLEQMGYFLRKENVSSLEIIQGVSIMTGKAQGICRLIFERNQADSFQEGEILVAPMTSPWYINAMKRAAAVVTDEGGITCHAAIIARELKKPCVIGTKFATQILKDGDLIEVDADRGIIRILK